MLYKANFTTSMNFNPTVTGPIDVRTVVDTLSSLASNKTWKGTFLYAGMKVAVVEEGKESIWFIPNTAAKLKLDMYFANTNSDKPYVDPSSEITESEIMALGWKKLMTSDDVNKTIDAVKESLSDAEKIIYTRANKPEITNVKTALDDLYDIIETGGFDVKGFSIKLVESLPEIGEENTIYLVPVDGSDNKDEYLWIDGVWELIGSTQVNLENYATKDYVEEKTTVDYLTTGKKDSWKSKLSYIEADEAKDIAVESTNVKAIDNGIEIASTEVIEYYDIIANTPIEITLPENKISKLSFLGQKISVEASIDTSSNEIIYEYTNYVDYDGIEYEFAFLDKDAKGNDVVFPNIRINSIESGILKVSYMTVKTETEEPEEN